MIFAVGVAASCFAGWMLRHVQDPELAGQHDLLPIVVLLAGILVSALVASLVHVGNVSRLRARGLERTNVELNDQIADTRRGEREIRLLNEALERRVEERTAALNETIAELETFNYSVSHDLRSPLGAVINFAGVLQEDYGSVLDDVGRAHLGRLVSSADSAVSLIDGLLAFSRSGQAPLQKERVSMRDVVEDVVRELTDSSLVSLDDVRIGALPDAYADRDMMRVVFRNLIHNACKFSRPHESPQVEIEGQSKGAELWYRVRDYGVGFDMRFSEKLFKPFERLHSGEAAGAGVGLAIADRIVRRHDGRLDARSAVDEGATFEFTLPLGEGEIREERAS